MFDNVSNILTCFLKTLFSHDNHMSLLCGRCHAIDEIDGMWVSPNNMFNYAIQIADNLF